MNRTEKEHLFLVYSFITSATAEQMIAFKRLKERTTDAEIDGPMICGDGAWIAHSNDTGIYYAIETDGHCHT